MHHLVNMTYLINNNKFCQIQDKLETFHMKYTHQKLRLPIFISRLNNFQKTIYYSSYVATEFDTKSFKGS